MTWDGVDNDEEDSIARREAYEWMETSIPEGTKYILIFIRKGDAKGIYEALWRRFASLTVKELQQKFWSLEMKPDQQVAHICSHSKQCCSKFETCWSRSFRSPTSLCLCSRFAQRL